ncbi:MAG: hypothetical protein IPF93_13210 [Saprospiraceae bacterium]|nr:hypothetical protein [Saprospiraceae bacterium]
MKPINFSSIHVILFLLGMAIVIPGCRPKGLQTAVSGDSASKAYVAPGKYDEMYNFVFRRIQWTTFCIRTTLWEGF